MKKKVIIEKVPTSKKKVVIEGLPKAELGPMVGGYAQKGYYDSDADQSLNEEPEFRVGDEGYYEAMGRQKQYPIENVNRMGSDSYGQITERAQSINTSKLQPDLKKQKVKPAKPSFSQIRPWIPNTYSPNKYFAKANYHANLAFDDFGLIGNNPKESKQEFSMYDLKDSAKDYQVDNTYQTTFDNQNNAYSSPASQPTLNQDIWGYQNYPYQTKQKRNGGYLPHAQDGEEFSGENNSNNFFKKVGKFYKGFYDNPDPDKTALGAGIANLGVSAINTTKGFIDLGGTNRVNAEMIASENERKRQNLTAQYENPDTMNMMGRGWSGQNSFDGRIGYDTPQGAYGMQIRDIGGYGEPNVEVEGDEHIQLPNGFSQEIKGKKHSEGGIPLNLPSGTKISSEKLKLTAKFLRELTEVNPEYEFLKNARLPKTGSISYADLAKKFETKKYVDMLNSKTADSIQKGTAKMIIDRNNQNLEKIFALQEQNKLSGVHGPQVQQNAQQELAESQAQEQQESMMKHGGYHLPKAQGGKEVTLPNGKKVTAVKVKEPGKDYKPVPNMPGYYYRTTTTTTPGKDVITTVTSKAPGKGSVEFNKAFADARKAKLKEFTWNGKKYTTDLYKPTTQTITTPGQPTTTEAEDYVYIEPEFKSPYQEQTAAKSKNMFGIGQAMPMYIPQNYMRAPITSYDVSLYPVEPERINPYINDIQRAQYAAFQNVGTTGAELANRANIFGQGVTEYGKRYYDASVANAQARNQAALQNEQLRYQAALQNRANQWAVDQAIAQREGAIEQQKQLDVNPYLKAITDQQHMRDMMGYASQVYNPEVAKNLGMLETEYYKNQYKDLLEKTKKSGNTGTNMDCSSGQCVPVSSTKYGGKINIKKKKNKK